MRLKAIVFLRLFPRFLNHSWDCWAIQINNAWGKASKVGAYFPLRASDSLIADDMMYIKQSHTHTQKKTTNLWLHESPNYQHQCGILPHFVTMFLKLTWNQMLTKHSKSPYPSTLNGCDAECPYWEKASLNNKNLNSIAAKYCRILYFCDVLISSPRAQFHLQTLIWRAEDNKQTTG